MKITIQSTRGRQSIALPDNEVKVAEAVAQGAKVFAFPAAHHYGLFLSGNTSTPLDENRTLTSYHVHDNAALFLARHDGA